MPRCKCHAKGDLSRCLLKMFSINWTLSGRGIKDAISPSPLPSRRHIIKRHIYHRNNFLRATPIDDVVFHVSQWLLNLKLFKAKFPWFFLCSRFVYCSMSSVQHKKSSNFCNSLSVPPGNISIILNRNERSRRCRGWHYKSIGWKQWKRTSV